MLTYTLIPLSVGMFPHVFMHWLSARRATAFKLPMMAYPICIMIVWVPSVTLGILGHSSFDDLKGPEANSILIRLIEFHAPEILAGLLGAGVLAAVMSSLDSQVLAIGNMFTQDVVSRYGFGGRLGEKQQVLAGRLFVGGLLLVTYLLSLVMSPRIFSLAVWSFSGFAALLPVAVAALYWRRSTAAGTAAATLTVAGLWLFFFSRGHDVPDYTVMGTGIMPVAVMLGASALALVVVSLLTRPPSEQTVDRFFP